jgi:chemotaxis protein histidine kinase CheA
MAAEEQRFREEMARREEERRRKELEARATVEEQRRRELEIRVADEEKKRKELERRASAEEDRRREIESKIKQEEERRKQFEELAANEERLRKELEEKMREEVRRRQEEVRLAEEMRRKESELRIAEEQRKLDDMRRQVEDLTRALEQEKNARQEISRLNLQSPVKQLREALETAWINGAPDENIAQELHQRAVSLSIPPDVEQSLIREVKLDMYSKAVKEVVAKRKLLRSSSSTLEWLRKVYQVSVAEYLENESKFLLDLVADQYKGTILLVSKLIGTTNDITPRLKSSGFAVVQAITPENALEKIEKVNPNIILCDADFPGGLSGVKFLHVLRANSKFNYVPFVLIGEAAEVAQLRSSELKPNEGVIKLPIEYEELTNLMNEKLAWFREYISSLK